MPRPVKIGLATAAFTSGYTKKSQEHREAVDKALRLMVGDLRYPSLRARKMSGSKTVWEAHATREVVLTFDFEDSDTVRLRACCNHDIYRRP